MVLGVDVVRSWTHLWILHTHSQLNGAAVVFINPTKNSAIFVHFRIEFHQCDRSANADILTSFSISMEQKTTELLQKLQYHSAQLSPLSI